MFWIGLLVTSIPCCFLVGGISIYHFALGAKGVTTLQTHGMPPLLNCLPLTKEELHRAASLWDLGTLRNISEFLGGYYGFFWWLPIPKESPNDGTMFKHTPLVDCERIADSFEKCSRRYPLDVVHR